MRTPKRNVVTLDKLNAGDYILAERKGKRGIADARQATVHTVHTDTQYAKGVYCTDGRILFEDEWTFVLVESQADREATLRKLKEN